jgi:hypothetical protein
MCQTNFDHDNERWNEQLTANIDGLEADGKGGYLITDYLAGHAAARERQGRVARDSQVQAGCRRHRFRCQ